MATISTLAEPASLPAMNVALDRLRCPIDGRTLTLQGDAIVCADKAHRYPMVDGVPVLIDDSTSIFATEQVAASATLHGHRSLPYRIADAIRPPESFNSDAPMRFARFRDLVCAEAEDGPARVIVVGGGVQGKGMECIDGDPRVEIITTDVYISDQVAVACDAHQLPFADGSVDGVIVQWVLEHVMSPHDVVAEIHRVLRPAGLVYAETPFMQAVHEGAYDFTRFSDLGHRRLFRMFEEIDRGVALGPATSLLWAIRYFMRSIPRRSRLAVRLLDLVTSCSAFWLLYLDKYLSDHDGAYDAASGVFFLGRRAEMPVSDREIIAGYRGTMGGSASQRRGLVS
jgi:SAM-dependent methyltransferase